MEAETSGDTPRSMKLNFKHCIKTGVTNLKRYGIFLVKDIWPTDLLEDIYSLLEQNSKAQKVTCNLSHKNNILLHFTVE